jgi:hypothetical protein
MLEWGNEMSGDAEQTELPNKRDQGSLTPRCIGKREGVTQSWQTEGEGRRRRRGEGIVIKIRDPWKAEGEKKKRREA